MVNAHQRNALVLLFTAGMFSACTGGGSSPTSAHVSDAWTVPAAGPALRGVGRGDVVAYLAATQWYPHDIQRFDVAPTVHVIGDASDAQRQLIVDALAIVNTGMPGHMRLRTGDDYAAGSSRYDMRPGHIGVEFTPPGSLCDYRCDAYAGPDSYRDRGKVWYSPHHRNAALMAHEILHVIAVEDHSQDPNSVMHGSSVQPYARLDTLERDALLALYSDRLSEGDTPHDLGPWNTDAFVHGATYRSSVGMEITLDVEARNGFAVATIRTDAERMSPATVGLSGTVTWNGQTFGMTIGKVALHGDAALTMSLSALTGTLGLTDFDGSYRDLNFNVRWAQDGLIRTGGDMGTVDGWLYGANGRAAAGTSHTSDAAFAWAGGR